MRTYLFFVASGVISKTITFLTPGENHGWLNKNCYIGLPGHIGEAEKWSNFI